MAKKTVSKPKTKAVKKPAIVNSVKKDRMPTTIHDVLFAFQAKKISIPRNGNGSSSSGKTYKYATLDDVINKTHDAMQELGLAFTQTVSGSSLKTTLIAVNATAEPKVIESEIPLGNPSSPQEMGSRITYMRRYALVPMLGLSIEEDLDSNPMDPNVDKPVAEKSAPATTNVGTTERPKFAPGAQNVSLAQRTSSFQNAWNRVQAADSDEAIELVRGAIDRSKNLTDAEKVELVEELNRRDTEMNGTVHA